MTETSDQARGRREATAKAKFGRFSTSRDALVDYAARCMEVEAPIAAQQERERLLVQAREFCRDAAFASETPLDLAWVLGLMKGQEEGVQFERERIVEGLLPWCLDCSVPVNVDEDGCCTMCGSDVFHDSDGEVQPVNAAFFRACGANHESTGDEK